MEDELTKNHSVKIIVQNRWNYFLVQLEAQTSRIDEKA